jgi:hypothetical protein
MFGYGLLLALIAVLVRKLSIWHAINTKNKRHRSWSGGQMFMDIVLAVCLLIWIIITLSILVSILYSAPDMPKP